MAIQAMERNQQEPFTLDVYGEPGDVRLAPDGPAVLVAGYEVSQIADAQHDGLPAKRFTLTVDNGLEIGRIVVRTGVATEYTFMWQLVFNDPEDAIEHLDRFNNPPRLEKHTVVTATVDMSYEGETLEEAIAGISAAYGISITVVSPVGPGGGWPVVKVLGRYENVHEMLCVGWEFSKADADALIMAVTG